MTPKTINMDNLKLLAIVTGEGEFVNKNLRTGLWLSELTHIYHGAKKQGIEITVASPKGGDTPIDPESLNPLLMDEKLKPVGKIPYLRMYCSILKVWMKSPNFSLIAFIWREDMVPCMIFRIILSCKPS